MYIILNEEEHVTLRKKGHIEFKIEDIPEDEYLIGSHVCCWVLDTHTGKVEKIEGYLQVYLDRVRYKLVNWD